MVGVLKEGDSDNGQDSQKGEALRKLPMTIYHCSHYSEHHCDLRLPDGKVPSGGEAEDWLEQGQVWCRQHASPNPDEIVCDSKDLVPTEVVALVTKSGMMT